jgi:hypothetical protein
MPVFYAERLQWHCYQPPKPSPPAAVTDDKLDVPGGSAHDPLNIAERFRVKIEHRHANEIATRTGRGKRSDSARLSALGVVIHHAGPRYHGHEAAAIRDPSDGKNGEDNLATGQSSASPPIC